MLHNQKAMSHYDFHRQVALAWLKPKEYWPKKKKTRQSPRIQSSVSTVSEESTSIGTRRSLFSQDTDKKAARCHRVTDKSLHPITGNLKDRLTTNMMHLPVKAIKKDSRCQLHYWAAKKKFRSNIVCSTCNVTLCIQCYEHFHLVQDLVKSKSTLKKEIDNDGQV